jgi:hypothetical protein
MWRTSERRRRAEVVSSDDEEEPEGGRCPECGLDGKRKEKCAECGNTTIQVPQRGETEKRGSSRDKERRQWARITRNRPGTAAMPEVGQTCVIMKGEHGREWAKMGLVVGTTAQRCWVGFRNSKTWQKEKRLKAPESLLYLEDGLEMVNDVEGRLWIKTVKK